MLRCSIDCCGGKRCCSLFFFYVVYIFICNCFGLARLVCSWCDRLFVFIMSTRLAFL